MARSRHTSCQCHIRTGAQTILNRKKRACSSSPVMRCTPGRVYIYTHIDPFHHWCRHVCDERWYNITRSIRLRGAIPMATQEALKQPTWCTLPPDKFEVVVERAPPRLPENVLFTYKVCCGPPPPPLSPVFIRELVPSGKIEILNG